MCCICDFGGKQELFFSLSFSSCLIQSGAKGKLVRSLAVCEESSPRPGAETLHDNQVRLQSLLLAAWLASKICCMATLATLLNWAFRSVFLGGKITFDYERISVKSSGLV